jgi:UDP-N-acetylglucosamine--N-acetylmuramyl-(pentapeptide) pyrophosphoryl-undecaprenol N-acetylglucosamine transferase
MKRVILTTGGTGGHIFPALAVAEEIRRRYPAASVLFLGGSRGPEADLAAKAGLEFAGLPVRGILGRGIKSVGALLGMVGGLVRARAIMARLRPEVVIGFGGYAAFAGLAAGRFSGVPTAVHEQNAIPGLTNRICARFARRVLISLPDERGFFDPARTLCTGNPVRASIAALHKASPRQAGSFGKRVLVMGGSQGAKAINDAIAAKLPEFLSAGVSLWHQTGRADCERMRATYRRAGAENMRVEPFINDMAAAYAWADLAVCRAGATTVAELTAAALPALFIPFPFATHDHQLHNARQLAASGMAVVLEQKDISPGAGGAAALFRCVAELLDSPGTLAAMSAAAAALAKPFAAAAVVDVLEELAGMPAKTGPGAAGMPGNTESEKKDR